MFKTLPVTVGLAIVLFGMSSASAQRRGGAPPGPATIPSTVADGAKPEKLAALSGEATSFTEGATSDKDGNVYFVDQNNNSIMKWDVSENKLSTFMKPAGYSNGMTFDNNGKLIACADERNEMWSIDVATKEHKVILKDLDGKFFNGPNDVWCHPTTGRLYFTDPYYRRTWWQQTRGDRIASEVPPSVYFFEPDTGKVVKLIGNVLQPDGTRVAPDAQHFVMPNGIVGTPDGKQLYVADINGRRTYVYDIKEDGTLSDGKEFCASGSDGMTIDAEGNLYLSSGGIRVFDKTGKDLGRIDFPERPANCCFGGKDDQTLFVTAQTGFYSIKMRVKGGGPQ